MMDRSHYLHVHIPGRGCLTLSLPSVERALGNGRLPDDAEAWHAGVGLWVTLKCHPAVVNLLTDSAAVAACSESLDSTDVSATPVSSFDVPSLPPSPAIATGFALDLPETLPLFPEHQATMAVATDSLESARSALDQAPLVGEIASDPAQLPLIPLEDSFSPDHELSQFVALSLAQERRRDAIRNSGGVRPSGAMRVFVAGAEIADTQVPPERPRWKPYFGPEVAASVTILIAVVATGFLIANRPSPGSGGAQDLRYTNESSGGLFGQEVSAAEGVAPLDLTRNPLAGPERDLESDLQIADIVTWQPAVDFSSEEQTLRATRKVDAVRNVISLYRVNAWRLMDGAHRDADPWLEPYNESSRIDEVLGVMKSAVMLLDSAATRFHVDGNRLVFESEAEADRYLALRLKADSLLQAPVEQDSFPSVRPPRRVVTRLLASLPPAITQFRVQ